MNVLGTVDMSAPAPVLENSKAIGYIWARKLSSTRESVFNLSDNYAQTEI